MDLTISGGFSTIKETNVINEICWLAKLLPKITNQSMFVNERRIETYDLLRWAQHIARILSNISTLQIFIQYQFIMVWT